MAEPFVGMILPFPYNFAPYEWSFCQGQQMTINQNNALYALLGVTFGGDSRTYFNLPEMRARTIVGAGQGQNGLSHYALGETSGYENITLNINQLPSHAHTATFTGTGGSATNPVTVGVQVSLNASGNKATPDTNYKYLAPGTYNDEPVNMWSNTLTTPVALGGITVSGGGGGITGGTVAVGYTGSSQSISILNPTLALNFCIALNGIFPSRNP